MERKILGLQCGPKEEIIGHPLSWRKVGEVEAGVCTHGKNLGLWVGFWKGPWKRQTPSRVVIGLRGSGSEILVGTAHLFCCRSSAL